MQLVAVDFLPPQVLQRELLRVSGLLASGSITPLCTANYSLSSVVAAMRLLAQASHVGKVRGPELSLSAIFSAVSVQQALGLHCDATVQGGCMSYWGYCMLACLAVQHQVWHASSLHSLMRDSCCPNSTWVVADCFLVCFVCRSWCQHHPWACTQLAPAAPAASHQSPSQGVREGLDC
jgi:hypothetical protein